MDKENLKQLIENLQEARINLVAAKNGVIREKELFEIYLYASNGNFTQFIN